MSSMPDLRGLKKGEQLMCGTNMNFRAEAKTVISMLCFDCGRSFGNAENKRKHVNAAHPTSNDKGNNVNACEVCQYKKRNKEHHAITVRAKHLQLPQDYPAVDVDSSDDHEVPHEAQPQVQEAEEEGGEQY